MPDRMKKFFADNVENNPAGISDPSGKEQIQAFGRHRSDQISGNEYARPAHDHIDYHFNKMKFVGKKTFIQNAEDRQDHQRQQNHITGKSFDSSGDQRSISSGDEQIDRTVIKSAGDDLAFFTAA